MLLTKEITVKVIDRILKGEPQDLILKELNLLHNRNSIRLSAKKYKINFPITRNTNLIKGTYFDNLKTDNQLYILGLLYADGCIQQTGHSNEKLNLVLNNKDLDTIKFVLKELKPNGSPYFIPTKNQVGFQITLPYLTNRLKELGVIYRKSYSNNLDIPLYIFQDKTLFFSFLRGFFDGDGSIFKATSSVYQKYGVNFSSCNNTLLQEIVKYLNLYLPMSYKNNKLIKVRKDVWSKLRKTDLYQIVITNPLIIMWLANNMYLNSGHFMARKHKRFFEYAINLQNTQTNLNNFLLVKKEAEIFVNNNKNKITP